MPVVGYVEVPNDFGLNKSAGVVSAIGCVDKSLTVKVLIDVCVAAIH
jgi:hypothetical protein